MHYINLGLLLIILGFVIGVYVHTDKKIDAADKKLSDRIDKLSDEIRENNKSLNDRMDRLYDILVHMGFRDREQRMDKAANE
ncbi:MAG: hypothetical protein ACYCSB_06255 [bacterium]|jgi:prefoldin subunit 5